MARKTPEGNVKMEVRNVFARYRIIPIEEGALYDDFARQGVHGVFWTPGSVTYGTLGQSDFMASIKGRMLAIETKADGKSRATALQQRFLDGITKSGGIALVIRNRNMHELESAIRLLGRFDPYESLQIQIQK